MKLPIAAFASLLVTTACTTRDAEPPPMPKEPAPQTAQEPTPTEAADASPGERLVGEWAMETEFQGQSIPATMTVTLEDGDLVGSWHSNDMTMPVTDLRVDGANVFFSRTMGPGGADMRFVGNLTGDYIEGVYDVQGRKLYCSGERLTP